MQLTSVRSVLSFTVCLENFVKIKEERVTFTAYFLLTEKRKKCVN